MISDHYGLGTSVAQLRERFGTSLKGMSFARLIECSQALGLMARPVRLELQDLKNLKLPCILHWNFDHFVVLESVRSTRIVVLDPSSGRRSVSMMDASVKFTGVALELSPGPDFRQEDVRSPISWRSLTGKIKGLKGALNSLIAISLAIEILALLSPQVTQAIVDGALVNADADFLLVAVLGGGMIVVFDTAFRVFRGLASLQINQQISMQWTGNLLTHLLHLPLTYFERRSIGDIAARFSSLSAVRNFVTGGVVSGIIDGMMSIATFAMMLVYSAQLTIVVILSLVSYGILRLIFYPAFLSASEQRIVASAAENSHFLETIRAAQSIKVFNMVGQRLSGWSNLMAELQNRDVKTQRLSMYFGIFNTAIFGAESLIILYFGGNNVIEGAITLGMLLAFMAYKTQFSSRFSKLIDLFFEFRMLGLHKQRIADIALHAPEAQTESNGDLSRLEGTIEFCKVGFRYGPEEPWLFKDLSFKIFPGESVALVGESGCGKTTLLKMLTGVLQPQEGELRVGGLSVKSLGLTSLRKLVGAVLQDDILLAGSLFDNICCFQADAKQENVERAARLAHIHFAISKMPMGYQTLVGGLADGLSAGQKQRLMLARAIYRNPLILALDEATANLDLHGEKHVIAAIKNLNITRL